MGEYTATDTTTGCDTANCEAGNYCGQGAKTTCTEGFYCEVGIPDQQACPKGFYKSDTGGTVIDDCVACDAGYACTVKGSIQTTAQCNAGAFCLSEATTTTPREICRDYDPVADTCTFETTTGSCATGTYNAADSTCELVPTTQSVCPQGFYCPQGTTEPVACDPGYFSTSYAARDDSLCIECTEGFYCSDFKARQPCDAGYYCVG